MNGFKIQLRLLSLPQVICCISMQIQVWSNFLQKGVHLNDDICPFYGLLPHVLHQHKHPIIRMRAALSADHAAFMWPMLAAAPSPLSSPSLNISSAHILS